MIVVPKLSTRQKPPLGWRLNTSHSLARGLAVALPMNELSGTTIYDLSNRWDGTFGISGAYPRWVADGIEADLNQDNYITLEQFHPGTQFTFITRINPFRDTYSRLASKHGSTYGFNWFFGTNSGEVEFYRSTNGSDFAGVTWSNVVVSNQIVTLALTYGDGYATLYKDGVLVSAQSLSGGPFNATSYDFWLFRDSFSGPGYTYEFDGIMYYFYVYSEILTPSKIALLYCEPYAMFQPEDNVIELLFLEEGGLTGTICWGHSSGVTEDNTRTFVIDWTGTGSVSGSGDAEIVTLDYLTSEYIESITWEIGSGTVILDDDKYGSNTRGQRTIKYKTGTDESDCNADTWHTYSTPVDMGSDTWMKIRVEAT